MQSWNQKVRLFSDLFTTDCLFPDCFHDYFFWKAYFLHGNFVKEFSQHSYLYLLRWCHYRDSYVIKSDQNIQRCFYCIMMSLTYWVKVCVDHHRRSRDKECHQHQMNYCKKRLSKGSLSAKKSTEWRVQCNGRRIEVGKRTETDSERQTF